MENEISKLTNSAIGSQHWFNTILGFHRRVGEYLKDNEIPPITLKQWGSMLEEGSIELMEYFDSINK